ncbi:MAG: hypothetical protein STSR0009_24110 [Methanoregula sp.]
MDTAGIERKNGNWKYAVLLVLSVVIILLTVYCLQNGIQTVFTHIYYVPIILAAFWFQKKGLLYSAGMGLIYLAGVIYYTGYNPMNIVSAVARVVVFVIIAAVVMVLSMRISSQQGEIKEADKKFRTVWEHIQAGIILVDAHTHEIIAVNPEGERLTGYTEKEMIGHSCHRFICPAETGKCPISDLGMTIDHSERVMLNRDGKAVPVLKTVTATTIGGRDMLIENVVALPEIKNP